MVLGFASVRTRVRQMFRHEIIILIFKKISKVGSPFADKSLGGEMTGCDFLGLVVVLSREG